jgi:hypothetical protein
MKLLGRIVLLGALVFWVIGPATAVERILDFKSRIQIGADGVLTVTETIRVAAEGAQIKRGIFRDFPTTRLSRTGDKEKVSFDVIQVLRDGRAEPHFMRDISGGKRLYIGDEDVFLSRGAYTYTIVYRSDRQISFFDDLDELYWNVTGNAWKFPIAQASAEIELPPGASVKNRTAYTGPVGAKGRNFATAGFGRRITFATTQALRSGEGLTVAVSWPKGFVTQPGRLAEAGYFLRDNAQVLVALAGVVIVLAYYLWAWNWVGRDPEEGTIVPLFAPPEGFSPAATRFVRSMGFDQKAFAAAVVNMAVKGYLTIEESDDGDYVLATTGQNRDGLSPGELEVAKRLIGGLERIELDQENHERISGAIDGLKAKLREEFAAIHFLRNLHYFAPGAAISLLVLIVLGALEGLEDGAGLLMGLVAMTFMSVVMMRRARTALQRGSGFAIVKAVLFAAGAFVVVLAVLGASLFDASWLAISALVVLAGINVLFYFLLKAPTLRGRKVMDEIEGFRDYLSVAEKERLAVLNPPEQTPELFERYLPYALALDVEHEWSEQFATTLAAAGMDTSYQPHWYSGHLEPPRNLGLGLQSQ